MHPRSSRGRRPDRGKRPPNSRPGRVSYASFHQSDNVLKFLRGALNNVNRTEIIHNLLEKQDTTLDVLLKAQFSLYSERYLGSLSLQRIAIGFLKLLDPKPLSIVPLWEVTEFLHKVSNSPFISSVLNQLMAAVEEGWHERAANPENWCVRSISEALLLVCITIDTIYTNKPEVAGTPHFLSWRNLVKSLINDLETLEGNTDALQEVKHHSSQFKVFSDRYKEIRAIAHKEQSVTRSTAPTDDPVSNCPGQLGHDNDHVNYRDIVVLPTSGEVEFLINGSGSVWLPRSNTRYNYFENEVDRLLDKQYRLLRHELLFPLTVVLSNLSIVFGKVEAPEDQKSSYDHVAAQINRKSMYIKNLASPGSGDSYAMVAGYNTDIHTISGDIHHGVVFRASFDIPLSVPKSRKRMKEWLSNRGTRAFSNTQIGIYYHSLAKEYFLFTIAVDPEISNDNRLVITCSVPKTEAFRFGNCLNACYSQRLSPEESGQFMFLVPAVFYPMLHPVLNGLQQLNLDSLPFASVFSEYNFQDLKLPKYLEGRQIDFKPILSKNQRVSCPSTMSALQKTRNLIKNDDLSVLDPTQLDSLFHCLSHNVSLIQGPPGTGKSFLGKFIVKLLVNQVQTPKPILILSYSNHALDSFLLDLIEEEIVPREQVTKLGSHTKSPELESCLINRQARASTGRTGGSTVARLKGDLEGLQVGRFAQSRKFFYDFKFLKKVNVFEILHRSNPELLVKCKPFLEMFFPEFALGAFRRQRGGDSALYRHFIAESKKFLQDNFPVFGQFLNQEVNKFEFPEDRPCFNFLFNDCKRKTVRRDLIIPNGIL
ncbi:hypothetical protein GEMRC1_008396 [Eukaryota sp. GEM-RC1]